MRDPRRQPRILAKLRAVWSQMPDVRLGQLVVNLSTRPDPFYFEDDELEAVLDGWLAARDLEVDEA